MIKTAGTTVHYVFRNNFGLNYVVVDKKDFSSDDFRRLLRFHKGIKAIGGHSLRSILDLDSVYPDIKYTIFLRNPVDRFISHYNHGGTRDYHHMSLEERVQILGETDYKTKFIIGARSREEREYQAGEEDLEKAKQILTDDFSFVGLLEEFDESLVLMKDLLSLEGFDIRYESMNVTQRKTVRKKDIIPPVMEKLEAAHAIDSKLYRYAKEELYSKQKERYTKDLNADVESFRNSNKDYTFPRSQILKSKATRFLANKLILR